MKISLGSLSLAILITAASLAALTPAEARERKAARAQRAWHQADRGSEGWFHWERDAGPERKSAGGPKRVEVDLSTQRLRAWEGDRLVMQSRISSGRNNATPTGSFRASSYKARHHYSSLYHNAYMPYSVQVAGDVFIHGYSEVPRYPASHGCIRLPVSGSNPAKRFFEWVSPGTPIRIVN